MSMFSGPSILLLTASNGHRGVVDKWGERRPDYRNIAVYSNANGHALPCVRLSKPYALAGATRHTVLSVSATESTLSVASMCGIHQIVRFVLAMTSE